ncbi:MAG TPA: hydroxyisourate hydrolase [Candidatus Paceibacterota bacterium]
MSTAPNPAPRPVITIRVFDHHNQQVPEDNVPAAGLSVELIRHDGPPSKSFKATTDSQGVIEAPLQGDDPFLGEYEILLRCGEYYAAKEVESPFISRVSFPFHVGRLETRAFVGTVNVWICPLGLKIGLTS